MSIPVANPSLLRVREIVQQHLPKVDGETRSRLETWLATSGVGDESQALHELKRLCYQNELLGLLTEAGLDFPAYHTRRSLQGNAMPDEQLHPFPELVEDTAPSWPLLGHKVNFPFGVPACPLMVNSAWVNFHARRGFDVLTFKTVRSREHPPHRYPHWVFLADESLEAEQGVPPVVVGDVDTWPRNPHAFSMANSFGVGSSEPAGEEGWQADVARTKALLGEGQLLIVSVMGSHEVYSGAEMVRDFARVAVQAEAAGATVIELNLSCPNTVEPGGGGMKQHLLCEDAVSAGEMVRAVRRELKPETKLLIKLAFMPEAKLRDLVMPLVQEGQIDGVAGINTIPAQVRRPDGSPTFVGTSYEPETPRLTAGVSGNAVREQGLQFVRWLNAIRAEENLSFDIIGIGGVMTAADVRAYLQAGANAVQSATASWFSPHFAFDVRRGLADLVPASS